MGMELIEEGRHFGGVEKFVAIGLSENVPDGQSVNSHEFAGQ